MTSTRATTRLSTVLPRRRRRARLAPLAILIASLAFTTASARQEAGTGVLVVLRDGQTLVSLSRDGRLMGLPDRSPDAARLVTALLQTGTLERPAAIAGLANGQRAAIAGSTPLNDLRPIEPVGAVVRDVRPTFRWRPQLHATGYRVTIRDDHGAVIVSSAPIAATSWQSTTTLEPGRTYTWSIALDTPSRDDGRPPGGASREPARRQRPAAGSPPAPAAAAAETRFRIIDAEAARLLDARLARAGRSNLLKGLAFTQAGLLDQAEAAFTALAGDNQGSDRMRSLLDQIRAMRTAP